MRNYTKTQTLVGRKFGRLTVLKIDDNRKNNRRLHVLCQCKCGTFVSVRPDSLQSNKTTSCGCFHKEQLIKTFTKHGQARRGMCLPEYSIWQSIIRRCEHPMDAAYENYGGRGIRICDQWKHDFAAFIRDVGRRPSPQHSLDRYPNNDGNYEPGNVRWATQKQQMRNTRNNINITFQGRTMCLMDWAIERNIPFTTLSYRIKNWSVEKSLTQPVRKCNKYT
jgi:hypothetical protein